MPSDEGIPLCLEAWTELTRLPPPLLLKRLARHEDGIAALEFAIISPVLMLLVMGTMEVALILTAQVLMESATYSASRVGKTGQVATDSTREATIKNEIARIGGLLMEPSKIVVTSTYYNNFDEIEKPEPFEDNNSNGKRDNGEPFTDWNGNGKYDLVSGDAGYGAREKVVVYTSSYDWTLFTPLISRFLGTDGKMTISARAVVRNEPY